MIYNLHPVFVTLPEKQLRAFPPSTHHRENWVVFHSCEKFPDKA